MNLPVSLRLALPKGRMQAAVFQLLRDAGLQIAADERDYRPRLRLPGIDAKILKPQSIVHMLAAGTRDLGFAGADWVAELDCDLVELIDTGLDPVHLVAAAPDDLLIDGCLPARSLIVASEYPRLCKEWMSGLCLVGRYVRSYGATEVLPPEDADCIVDIAASGSTLKANGLRVFDELMTSSTRLYANREAYLQSPRREAMDGLTMLLASVLEARRRALIELNSPVDRVEALVERLPCIRKPTLSPLHGEQGFAIKAAVPRDRLWQLIPELKALGGRDLVVTEISQIVL